VFDSVRIRTKLAMALAIPLIALVALSSFVVALSVNDANEAEQQAAKIRDQVTLATSSLGPGGVLSAIQTERNAEAVSMLGINIDTVTTTAPAGATNVRDGIRGLTDTAIKQFRDTMATSPQAVQDIYAPSLAVLDEVKAIRANNDIDRSPKSLGDPLVSGSYTRYTQLVSTLFDDNSKVALGVDNAELRNGATLIDLTARSRELGSALTTVLVNTAQTNFEPTAVARVADAQAKVDDFDQLIARTAVGPYKTITTDGLNDPRITEYREMARKVAIRESKDIMGLIGAKATSTWEGWTALDAALGSQLKGDATRLQAAAEQDAADARDRQRNVGALALFVVLAASAVTLLASRSISRPLLRLAGDAEDMASDRLPGAVKQILDTPLGEDVIVPELASVPSGGGREINEVSVALNSVQTSAADLAVEQALLRRNIADSFVNLGRRNQNLLSRQIDSITEMERDETDPDNLERLFALDHLATRMRRNAESLLLLGGLEPHRQWSAPVPLIDALRGALGEVEDYQRVAIEELDEALVEGSATADVTHMFAELVENALNFSPPDRPVEIIGRRTPKGYSLSIVDDGVGMTDESLVEANRRLSGGESFTVAPSRYLGHYVVGVQAARLGCAVHLSHAPTGGVMATVELGAVLSTAPAEPAEPAAPAPTVVARASVTTTDGLQVVNGENGQGETAPAGPHQFVDEAESERFVPQVGGVRSPVADEVDPVPAAAGQGFQGSSTDADGGTTDSGYKRRVRGASVPNTEVRAARSGAGDRPVEADTNPAESVRNLLTGLQAGAERARSDQGGEGPSEG
jgi:signal transduction histidine kinase